MGFNDEKNRPCRHNMRNLGDFGENEPRPFVENEDPDDDDNDEYVDDLSDATLDGIERNINREFGSDPFKITFRYDPLIDDDE